MNELEHEYVQRRLSSCIASVKKRLERAGSGNRDRVTRGLAYWTEALESHQSGREHQGATRVKKMYAKALSTAVRDGRPLSKSVEESDAYRKAVENRKRYEKGRHTSFANQSAAVDASMKEKRGYKTKRQDGKQMTPVQIAEIDAIVTEFESVVGPLAELFARTDLTIAHTNGKHPFMRSSGGVYHTAERTISVGVVVGGSPIRAGAHELAHWLDAETGAAMGVSAQLWTTSGRRAYDSTYLSECVSRIENDPEIEFLADAMRSINREREAHQVSSTRAIRTAEGDRLRASLGPYWFRRCEIYARLTEQWLATRLGNISAAAESPEIYHSLPGWWTEADFLRLIPSVEKSVERRVEALRGTQCRAQDPNGVQDARSNASQGSAS